MKNGKSFNRVMILFVVGFAIGKINSRSLNSIKAKDSQGPSTQQYANRLVEFFDKDLDLAVTEYCEYLEMGFNPSDAFDIAKAKANL